jgi:molecular chaperone GrpE
MDFEMIDDPKRTQPTVETEQADALETEAERAADSERARLEAELAETKDRLLRMLAEMENLRRRTQREVKDAGQYAISGFARDVLSVADNLRRALDAVPAEALVEGPVATLVEGVGLTERELLKALEKHGVRRIEAQGAKFDPHLHQAMIEIPDTSVPNGTVLQVMQEGYVIGERVLRPALVSVSKGGPRREGPAEATSEAGATVDKTA